MSPSLKWVLILFLLTLVMGGAFAACYLSASTGKTSQRDSISSLESSVNSLHSHPVTLTITSTSTATSLVTSASTVLLDIPFPNVLFMVPPDLPNGAGCSGSSCFDGDFGDAIHFDCPNGATQGCTVELYNSYSRANYSIVASAFPQVGLENEPGWANCSWKSYVLSPVSGVPPQFSVGAFGYCVSIGPESFVIAEPAEPA